MKRSIEEAEKKGKRGVQGRWGGIRDVLHKACWRFGEAHSRTAVRGAGVL